MILPRHTTRDRIMSEGTPLLLVNFWFGPRTLSTATMYSFDQRSDTLCYDEPLYASWLSTLFTH